MSHGVYPIGASGFPEWVSQDGAVRLIHGDALKVLPTLEGIDAVVTDPQYGIGYEASQPGHIEYGTIAGDDVPFDPVHLLRYRSVILWGANNYADKLPIGGWICWDKRVTEKADAMLGSPFELAWINRQSVFKFIRVQHGGAKNADAPRGDVANQKRYHPTQKPIRVMSACLDIAKVNGVTCDPYMGSGTTGVACIRTGRRFIGIDIEPTAPDRPDYFGIAVQRCKDELSRFPLFEPQPKPKQQEMFQ